MYMKQGLSQKQELRSYVENKWGFLKNIININSFFSTGEAQDQSLSETEIEEQPVKKNTTVSKISVAQSGTKNVTATPE